MSDTLDLTFAELEFLFAEEPAWPATRAAIGLDTPPDDSAVAAAGLASLIVRKQVTTNAEEELVLSEDLTAAVALLSLPTVWLDLAVEQAESVLAGYVGLGKDEPIVVLSLAAPGVFTVQAHASEGNVPGSFGAMVTGLINGGNRILVQARSLDSDNVVFASRAEDGSLAAGASPESLIPATAEQVGNGASILARAALAG